MAKKQKPHQEPELTEGDSDIVRLIFSGLRDPKMTAKKLLEQTTKDCDGDEERAKRLLRFVADRVL